MRSGTLEWILAVVACVACGIFALVGGAQSSPAAPKPRLAAPAPTVTVTSPAPVPVAVPTPAKSTAAPATKAPVDMSGVGALTFLHTMPLRSAPNSKAPALTMVGSNITLPITGAQGGWVHVMSPCEISGWVPISQTNLIATGGPTSSLAKAVFVIDPGHGGSESGAIGPDGVAERTVNLALARKLAADLAGSRVYLTRTANYNVGLRFRALLASKLHATAFVSMHNNSGPTVPALGPGTQTWHQIKSPASAQLATFLWHNLYSALSKFKVKWVSAVKIGPQGRANTRGTDYYAVLRESTVPSVIVESLFINNKAEERLLRNSNVQDAIAAATATSLKQFVTSGDAAKVKPYSVKMDREGGLPSRCVDPT